MEIANSHNGSNILLQMTLEVFMKSERSLHKEEKPDDLVNGYPFRKAKGNDKELVLKVPRTRSSTFYPALLSILRGRVDHRTD